MSSSASLISDSNIFLHALEQALEPQFLRIAKHSTFAQAISDDKDWHRNILIVDAGQPNDVIEQLLSNRGLLKDARIIVVMRSNQTIDDYRVVLPLIGALLPDSARVQDISLTARIVGQGIALLPRVAITSLFPTGPMQTVSETPRASLNFTDREQAVLALISKGASNKLIGRQLEISESTVRVHVRAILRKLGMQNRTQAALYAAGRKGVALSAELLRPSVSLFPALA